MQSERDNALNKEPVRRTKPSRFRIEKLEEPIAPARGGIPGKPGGSDSLPPDYYGYCWLHGKHRWCDP